MPITYDARLPETRLKSVRTGDFVIMDSGVYRVYDDGQKYRFFAADDEYAQHEAERMAEIVDYNATMNAASYRQGV